MKLNDKEITALIQLLAEEDELIIEQVSIKIMQYDIRIIPFLEKAWSDSQNLGVQKKIETLIHEIQFRTIKTKLLIWSTNTPIDLLEGALLITQYQYPSLNIQNLRNKISEISRSIWMELHYQMHPIDTVKLINYILYVKYHFTGNNNAFHNPDNSYLNKVLESKKGNQISLAIIYFSIAQQLALPIQCVALPNNFILAYMDQDQALFYINPYNKGEVFGRFEINEYLKKINLERLPDFYNPCSPLKSLQLLIENLYLTYHKLGNTEKENEILSLLLTLSKT